MALNSSNQIHKLIDTDSQILSTRGSVSDRQVITAYGPKLRQQIQFTGESATKQSFKDECDINRIMARYQVTGVLPEQLMPGQPQFVDVTGVDYLTGMQKIAEAKSLFQALPATVRLRFKNDPGEFLDFAQDPNNQDELVELGLARRPPHEPLPVSPGETPAPPQASTASAPAARSTSGKGKSEVQSQNLPGVPDGEK